MFNIIARKTLLDYCEKYPDAANALRQWYYELINTAFKNFNELKEVYGSASLIGDDRVVFNIMGNKYRLVVRIVFEFKAIQVKWFGTHTEYNKIDVTSIQFKKNKMILKVIKTKKEYHQYLNWVDALFNKKVKPDTPEGEKLQVALLLIKQYEDQQYPVPPPDVIEAIKLRMQEKGLKRKDLIDKMGSKGYISAVFNKRKPLTLEMAKLFHRELGVSAEVLLAP